MLSSCGEQLQYIKHHDTADSHNVLHIFDFFYHKEHLFIVCELLRDNLYEFSRYNREAGCEPYFTLPRLRRIAKQCLDALRFVHNLDLIHCDLKPENILIRSYSRCEIKVIDFGSSCFTNDHLSSYVQSRSYRAPGAAGPASPHPPAQLTPHLAARQRFTPHLSRRALSPTLLVCLAEVILGLPYDQKIDLWSLGAILAELLTGYVLFQNDSVPSMLSRIVGILGPFPDGMLQRGRHAHKYFLPNGAVYERDAANRPCLLEPKMSPLRHRLHTDDELFISFVGSLLRIDPDDRPTAEQALQHPFITSDAYGEVLA